MLTPMPGSANALLLVRLLAAHFVADFVLQKRSWVQERLDKKWRSPWLYAHGAVAGIAGYLFAAVWDAAWLPIVIFLSHVLFDGAKAHAGDTARSFLLDQLAHVIIVVACWAALVRLGIPDILNGLASVALSLHAWTLALAYVVVVWPVGFWIGKVTEPWRNEIGEGADGGLARAGLWIGRLERILILTFLLLDRFEAIGLLVAAKSILRFGEIRGRNGRKVAEYVLIGTMISFAAALLVGLFAKWLIQRL
jgi:hypothetical protein